MDRRDLLDVFRSRLSEAMARGGLTQAALARRVGLDRSTLAQFLAPDNKRLPRADTLAALALDQQVSIDWLLPYMRPIDIPQGHVLFRKGEVADAMYFVSAGKIRIDELNVEIGKGSLFGEMGVFAVENVRTATAVCLEDCSLLRVSAERMRELFYQNPEFGFFLVGVITRRLMEDMERASGGKLAPT